MILLIIIFNDIILSPPITLTYHLIAISLYSQYTKFYPSIIKNRFSYIILLKSKLAVILFIKKRYIRHYNLLKLTSPIFFLFLSYNYGAVGYTSFF